MDENEAPKEISKDKRDALKAILEIAAEASERTRRGVITIVILNVVVLVALLNSSYYSWFNARLRLAYAATAYMNQAVPFDSDSNRRAWDASFPDISQHRVKAFLTAKGISVTQPEAMKSLLNYLQQAEAQRFELMSLPLNVTLDLRDLAFLPPTAFISLLIWTYFASIGEEKTIRFALSLAKHQGLLIEAYEWLSGTQLLNEPTILLFDRPSLSTSSKFSHYKRSRLDFVIWIPIFSPAILLAVSLIQDIVSSNLLYAIRPLYTPWHFIIGFALYWALLQLAWLCTKRISGIRRIWDQYFAEYEQAVTQKQEFTQLTTHSALAQASGQLELFRKPPSSQLGLDTDGGQATGLEG